MRRALGLVIAVVLFMVLFVSNASAGSITVTVPPPPTYPNWGCAGNCTQQFGIWNITGGSVLNTNIGEQYVNEQVTVNVTSFVTAQGAHATITVDAVAAQLSDTGPYQWTYYNQGGGYHQIYITCDSPCQGNFLVSIQPLGAPTPTPTDFPTSTPVPFGTPPPTNTPVPVGHVTNTPTPSPTACVVDAWGCDAPATATYVACETGVTVNYGLDPCAPTPTPAAPTATPSGGVPFNCGDATFPLLNCSMLASTATGVNQTYPTYFSSQWQASASGFVTWASKCSAWSGCTGINATYPNSIFITDTNGAEQQYVVAAVTGTLHVSFYDHSPEVGGGLNNACVGIDTVQDDTPHCTTTLAGHDTTLTDLSVTSVTGGTGYWFRLHSDLHTGTGGAVIELVSVWVVPDSGTPYVTATGTAAPPGATWTPRPTFTATPVRTATPYPPGYVPPTATILANIDTCLGSISDCSLNLTPIAGKAGGIPGLIATPMAPLNTSIFSPFQTIAITRGGCLSFGKMPILVPHISWLASPVPGPHVTVTPNITGYVPISVTWTLPTVVGTPMRQGVYGPIDPLEYEPCNDPAIPTWGWDLTWNASTFFEWLGFFVWTVSLLRRLFG